MNTVLISKLYFQAKLTNKRTDKTIELRASAIERIVSGACILESLNLKYPYLR